MIHWSLKIWNVRMWFMHNHLFVNNISNVWLTQSIFPITSLVNLLLIRCVVNEMKARCEMTFNINVKICQCLLRMNSFISVFIFRVYLGKRRSPLQMGAHFQRTIISSEPEKTILKLELWDIIRKECLSWVKTIC